MRLVKQIREGSDRDIIVLKWKGVQTSWSLEHEGGGSVERNGGSRTLRVLVSPLCWLMAMVSHWGNHKTFCKNRSSLCVENVLEGGMRSSLFNVWEVIDPILEFHFLGFFFFLVTTSSTKYCIIKVQSQNRCHAHISNRSNLTLGIGDTEYRRAERVNGGSRDSL